MESFCWLQARFPSTRIEEVAAMSRLRARWHVVSFLVIMDVPVEKHPLPAVALIQLSIFKRAEVGLHLRREKLWSPVDAIMIESVLSTCKTGVPLCALAGAAFTSLATFTRTLWIGCVSNSTQPPGYCTRLLSRAEGNNTETGRTTLYSSQYRYITESLLFVITILALQGQMIQKLGLTSTI